MKRLIAIAILFLLFSAPLQAQEHACVQYAIDGVFDIETATPDNEVLSLMCQKSAGGYFEFEYIRRCDNGSTALVQAWVNPDALGGGVQVSSRIRKFAPIECERLQAFPDNWTKYGIFNGKVKEISDTQRYKCCGNAVTTYIVKWAIEQMFCKG